MSELCGRCGNLGACGAAGLCYACNDLADAQERDEPESCIRWGAGPDRCVLGFDHLKLLKGNYERLFDAARQKVRAWEKANVK